MQINMNPGAAATALAITLVLPSALAQTSDEAGEIGRGGERTALEEIVVTAQFREQRLQDTPLAITAIAAETLRARDQVSISDVGEYAPNVNIMEAPSYFGSSLSAFIRGVGQNDSSFALEPGVGIYVDDVYYGTTFGAVFDLNDVERVEVLRGPQGTLAGKNSVGGAVKLFSKKPDGEGGGFVEGTYGELDRVDIRASVDFALTDVLFARLSGVSRRSDGYVTRLDYGCVNPGDGIPASPSVGADCKAGTEGGKDVKALRLALRYAPADSPVEINLVVDGADDDSEATASKLVFADNPNFRSFDPFNPFGGVPFDSRFLTGPESYTNYSSYSNGGNVTTIFGIPNQVTPGTFTPKPEATAEGYGVAGTVDVELSDHLSLKSITAYRDATGTSATDFSTSPLTILLQALEFSHRQFTQELRLSGQAGALDYTIGSFYYDAKDRLKSRVEIPDSVFDFTSNDPVTNRSVSVFAHGELNLLPDLNLIGGIRYTDDKKTYTFSRRNIDGTPPSGEFFAPNFLIAGLDGVSGTYDESHVDYRLGANYRWNDTLMAYVQVSTGFKGGGINPRPFVPDQVRNFGPETVTAYEAGFKADTAGDAVTLNGAVFYNDYEDMQLTLFACPPSASPACSAPANAGDAKVKGVELETQLRLLQGLTIDASLGYIDFEYSSVDPLTGVTPDMQAPFISEWQSSAGIQYEAQLGDAGTLTPRLDWSYQSSFYYRAVNHPLNEVQGRSLFAARLGYETADGEWSVSAGVNNLLDKFYYVGLDESITAYGLVTGYVGRPREWYLSVRWQF